MENVTKRGVWIGGAAAVIVVVAIVIVVVLWARSGIETASPPSPEPTASDTPTPTPTPSPTFDGPPPNDEEYEAGDLPVADVFGVNADLPVDDAPDEKTAGKSATPNTDAGVPVFADPKGEPVAWLPSQQRHGGSTVPVVEEHDAWVEVLLVGRQGVAGSGDPAQASGWLRAADVDLADNEMSVEVSIADHTIDVVTGTGGDASRETVSTDFAWGTESTPTPVGRAFIMNTETVERLAYTRGNPIVYLSVQSPTMAGFDGQSVAVTAFHYHDAHSGAISNGCLRVDADAIARLAELPAGTPVYIS